MDSERRFVLLRLAAFAVVLGCVFLAVAVTGSIPTADEIRDRGEELGALAVLLCIPAFVVLNFGVAWPILAGAFGLLFGTAAGTPLSLAGVLCAALVQMALARHLAGEHVGNLLPRRFRAVEAFLQRRGVVAVAQLRIVPALPWGPVNYAAGLTTLRFRDMALGTVTGGAPKVFAYTALGGSLANLGSIEARVAIGLMVVVAIVGALVARRELTGARPGGATGAA